MIVHKVKVYPSKITLPKKKQLAWKIAEIAADKAKLNSKDSNDLLKKIPFLNQLTSCTLL